VVRRSTHPAMLRMRFNPVAKEVTWCVIEEVHSGDWSIAGKPLTTAAVKHLAAGQPATT
jgi:phenylpyruvate tautomerase PptA (4-oxalocrotonate tautomerase family)